MKALILAGGKGSRLQPYTTVLPKPLMPVGDDPILSFVLRQLAGAGILDVILAVGSLEPLFRAVFDNGQRFGIHLEYSTETHPLGTAGPIAQVLDQLGDQFLVMNGDLLTTMDYGAFWEFHLAHGAALTIAAARREVPIDFGVLQMDSQGFLQSYLEKPIHSFDVSMGIYAMQRRAVAPFLKKGEAMDFPALVQCLLSSGQPVCCYREDCYWLDIGRIEDYRIANEVIESRKSDFIPKQ